MHLRAYFNTFAHIYFITKPKFCQPPTNVPLDLDFLSFVIDINNDIVTQQEVKKLSFLSGCRGGSPCKVKPQIKQALLAPLLRSSHQRSVGSCLFYPSLSILITLSSPHQEVKKLSFLRVWAEPTKVKPKLSNRQVAPYCEAVRATRVVARLNPSNNFAAKRTSLAVGKLHPQLPSSPKRRFKNSIQKRVQRIPSNSFLRLFALFIQILHNCVRRRTRLAVARTIAHTVARMAAQAATAFRACVFRRSVFEASRYSPK